MSLDNTQHAAWRPYVLSAVDCDSTPRTALIGRSVAMLIDGVEVVLHARTADDLASAFGSITGKALDEGSIYKATLMHSDGVIVQGLVEEPPVLFPGETLVGNTIHVDPTDPDVQWKEDAVALDKTLADAQQQEANDDARAQMEDIEQAQRDAPAVEDDDEL